MAFIALVHIPDHTAEHVIERMGVVERFNELPEGSRWVGLYEFPDRVELRKGCTGCTAGRKTTAWTRHKKGHMMCANCGGRNPNVRRWFVGGLFDWFGANLYPLAPALFRSPEGYGDSPR
jgi:hypothetical protein